MRHCFSRSVAFVVAGVVWTGASSAAAVQFDLGLAADAAAGGAYAGTGPAHAEGWLTAGQTAWNAVNADKNSGVVDAGGGSTSITLDIGQQVRGTQFSAGSGWNFALTDFSGYAQNSGSVYQTALMGDLLYSGSTTNIIGVRVNGLDAGEYRVYLAAYNPNAASRVYDVEIGVNGNTATSSPYLPNALTLGPGNTSGANSAWMSGINYVAADVTVGSTSDYVTVFVDPGSGGTPVFNALQIVPVPEPASLGLLALAGLALLRRRG